MMCRLLQIYPYALYGLVILSVPRLTAQQKSKSDIAQNFKDCKVGSSGFDSCVMKGLNSIQKYFPMGIPEYGVASFDPFFAKEVNQKRGGPNLNYKLKLMNVYEYGWSKSQVTKFRSDLKNNMIQYSQFFPEKSLRGEYEIEGRFLDYPMKNKGVFNLTLVNYTQTTTAIRRPNASNGKEARSIRVKIAQDRIGDMKLHISNLLRGRSVMENILDRMINVSWRPFLPAVKPIIDDVVSIAFTDIMTKNFQNFPFEEVFS